MVFAVDTLRIHEQCLGIRIECSIPLALFNGASEVPYSIAFVTSGIGYIFLGSVELERGVRIAA